MAVLHHRLWAMGGCTDNGVPMDSVEVLELPTGRTDLSAPSKGGQWCMGPPMPTARAGFCSCTSETSVITLGGCGDGSHFLNVVEWLDLANGPVWHTGPTMLTGRRYPTVALCDVTVPSSSFLNATLG